MSKSSFLLFIPVVIFFLLTPCGMTAESAFDWHGNRLRVRTAALELVWSEGTIAAVTCRRTGEVFSNARPADFLAEIPCGTSVVDDWGRFVDPYGQKRPAPQKARGTPAGSGRLRPRPDSTYEFRQQGPDEAEIVVRNLVGGAAGDELTYRVRVENDSGEVALQAVARSGTPGKPHPNDEPAVFGDVRLETDVQHERMP